MILGGGGWETRCGKGEEWSVGLPERRDGKGVKGVEGCAVFWPLFLRTPGVWVPLIFAPNFNWSLPPSPIPTSQVFSQFSPLHTLPSAILPDSCGPTSMLGFLKVHSRCASPPQPSPTPTPAIILAQSGPSNTRFLQLHLRKTFSCPSLNMVLPPLALGLLSSISRRYSQDPIIHHFGLVSLFIHPYSFHDPHTPFLLRPLLDLPHRTLHGSPRAPCIPLHLHTNGISGFPFIPTPVLSSFYLFPSSSSSSCPAPKFRARFPGRKQEKSE